MNFDADDLFEQELLKIIEDKKDKSLVLVERAIVDWPENRLMATDPEEIASYFIGLVRRARSELYSAHDYGKKNRQESSGGENGQ